MAWRTEERRRNYWLPLGLTFLLGLLLGWWVIGWWLWPVSYTNALPPDLRSQEKQQYLSMVADSFAVTGDVKTAQARTASWSKDQLASDMTTLQASLAQTNAVEADNVRRLATALGAAGAAGAPAAAQAQPKATAAPATASPGILQRLCPGLLWIALILAGIAIIAFLWSRWRQTQSGQGGLGGWQAGRLGGWRGRQQGAEPGQMAEGAAPTEDEEPESVPPWHAGLPPAGQYDLGGRPDVMPADGQSNIGATPGTAVTAAPSRPPRPQPAPVEPPVEAPSTAAAGAEAAAAGGADASGGTRLSKVAEYTAAYHAGESDYDQGFDIKDERGNMVGQCALTLVTPGGAHNDQAAAFRVWLWDPKDQFTQTRILMSDSAYRDTARRNELAGEEQPVAVKPGTEFDLESRRFVLYGKVGEAVYAEQEPFRQIFNSLAIQLKVFQKE